MLHPAARIVLLVCASLAAGCGLVAETPERLAGRYLDLIANGRFSDAVALLSPSFLEQTRETGRPWREVLLQAHTRMGALTDHVLHERTRGLTPERDGELLSLLFEVRYDRDTVFEELTVEVRRDRLAITRHEIRSPWLSDLVPEGEQLVDAYLDALHEGDLRAIGTLYAKRLRGRRLRAEIERISHDREKHGTPSRHRLIGVEKHPGRSLERDVVLVYTIDYAAGRRRERFWIKRTLEGRIGLVDHSSERDLQIASD